MSKEVLLELLEAVWMSKTLSLGLLLDEEVTDSFFTSSSSFWVTTSKAVLSLDLRLVCLVMGSLSRGFSRDRLGLAWFPN